MRPSDVLRRATGYLDAHGVESPGVSAEVLLAGVLGTDRAGLYSRSEGLTSAEARSFGRALCQRCTGTPLQHLTGEQQFRGITLRVRPGVFVPRPETELVVGAALRAIKDAKSPVVADVGTGTGAIALSIKSERPDAKVYATDLSAEAVRLASENSMRLGLDTTSLQGAFLDPLPVDMRGRLDLVVSNPPYLTKEEMLGLADEVLADPVLSLEMSPDTFSRLAQEAALWLRQGGALVTEIGEFQSGQVCALLGNDFHEVAVLPDLTGRDRIVTGVRS